MRFPNFLVIGAMKAGTTSLCRDLEAHPNVLFPSVKEPHTLTLDRVLSESGRREYAALFRNARPDQVCGEGSTGYTKLPVQQGIPVHAHEIMGDTLKLIYIVREPISRLLSYYYHLFRVGNAAANVRAAVESMPELICFSQYAMQVEPWPERSGADNVRIIRFETYINDRGGTVSDLYRFLNVHPKPEVLDEASVHNAGREPLLPPESIRRAVATVTRISGTSVRFIRKFRSGFAID